MVMTRHTAFGDTGTVQARRWRERRGVQAAGPRHLRVGAQPPSVMPGALRVRRWQLHARR